jgi:hypothetical protein
MELNTLFIKRAGKKGSFFVVFIFFGCTARQGLDVLLFFAAVCYEYQNAICLSLYL